MGFLGAGGMVPTTFCQRCLGGPVADQAGPERCPVSASRAGIPGERETDALLARRLAAGDDHALAEIFDRLAPAVYAAALGVTGQSAAAQLLPALVPRDLRVIRLAKSSTHRPSLPEL
jgi:hypothetical protein